MTGPDRCPNCGSEPPAGSPGGLCPRCLLGGVLRGSAPAATTAAGVLDALAVTVGPMPRVLLRDTDPTGAPGPVVRPTSAEMPGPADRAGRLHLLGEIARGGMGAVLKGRDNDLGRDLAVKVLLDRHGDDPGLVRRFVEEAQIAGQLQHPGVVPVYELGTFADHRPYFAMKLVKGRTLAEVLAARPDPSADRPWLLSTFLDVAQTMAYAHARGVIHCDLKPSNVMVGSFGEVQVMDWGLAKLLPRGGAVDDESAGRVPANETVIATARSASGADLSMAGSVMGTPSYMAPEQARGEDLDERADVFALGSILCEVLTGQPAFTGRTAGEIQRKAARADLGDVLALLPSCGADPELLALAEDCLAAEPDDRPADAGIIAGRLSAHLVGEQARVQAAERDRAVAQAQAVEERRRRKLQAGLAASVLALAAVGGLAGSHLARQRQATAAAVDRALGETTTLLGLARQRPEDPAGWRLALAAARRVEDGPGAARLLAARAEAEAGLGDAERDAILRQTLVEVRANVQDAGADETDATYAAAFRAAGLDLDALAVPEAAARLRRRAPAVVVELAAYLDHWAEQRQDAGRPDPEKRRPVEVARAADPDPFRDRVRASLVEGAARARAAARKALVADPRSGDLAAATAVSLAAALADPAEAVALLRKAAGHHPGDLWVNFALTEALCRLRPVAVEEAIRHYSVARALRPETAHRLAHLLDRSGRAEEAEATFRDLVARRPAPWHLACFCDLLKKGRKHPDEAAAVLERLIRAGREAVARNPGDVSAHIHLGNAHRIRGDLGAAIASYREAARLRPDDGDARSKLGAILDEKGDLDAAIIEHREAARIGPDDASAHRSLAMALHKRGDQDGAIAAYREAIRLKPEDPYTHLNLAIALENKGDNAAAVAALREAIRLRPGEADVHFRLGRALSQDGELDAAIAAYREAARLRPDLVGVLNNLGGALYERGDNAAAIEAFREAIRLKPDLAEAHSNLGRALEAKGDLDAALVEHREAIRLRPGSAPAHDNLGVALGRKGDLDAAILAYREAIRLDPKHVNARINLANDLAAKGEVDAAIAEHREAIRLQPGDARAHFGLGGLLNRKGEVAAAIAAYREAIRHQPDLAEAHCNLGLLLRDRGDHDEALAELRRGHELGSKRGDWKYPSADWIRDAEREAALAARLAGVLAGSDRPVDAAEWVAFAGLCRTRGRGMRRPAGSTPGPSEIRRRPRGRPPIQRRLLRGPRRVRPGQGRPAPRRPGEGRAPRSGPRLAPGRPCPPIASRRRGPARGPGRRPPGLGPLEGRRRPRRGPRPRRGRQAPRGRAGGVAILLGRGRRPAVEGLRPLIVERVSYGRGPGGAGRARPGPSTRPR